jgi:hypothetical protein
MFVKLDVLAVETSDGQTAQALPRDLHIDLALNGRDLPWRGQNRKVSLHRYGFYRANKGISFGTIHHVFFVISSRISRRDSQEGYRTV